VETLIRLTFLSYIVLQLLTLRGLIPNGCKRN
jgi:hypothetical protein